VAETDAKARAEYEPHLWYFARRLLRGLQVSPPGYTSAQSTMRMSQAFGGFLMTAKDWDEVVDGSYAVVGSPETVTEKLCAIVDRLGAGYLLGLFQLGTLPHAETMANIGLFADQVLPKVKAAFPAGPTWAEAG
jgi:alkanesulfonate monooxygenase SsuD/methylene tetrahydromethanopterin reductase-like flavin-dependent oxidoreductase (luciferase family)